MYNFVVPDEYVLPKPRYEMWQMAECFLDLNITRWLDSQPCKTLVIANHNGWVHGEYHPKRKLLIQIEDEGIAAIFKLTFSFEQQ